jgi:NAD(P)-dependent dehydrogenase (short-subunit alcohol dehydrogenase family)
MLTHQDSDKSPRSALITGGSRGIGLSIARMLAGEGYTLTIAARNSESLDAARTELEGEAAQVLAVSADVAVDEQAAALIAAHRERFGRLDVLVNNAGAAASGPVANVEMKTVDGLLATNLRSSFLVTREALPLLTQAGAEHERALIVNLASIVGVYGAPGLAGYSAAKAGVIALSESLHTELAGTGVRVSALCPAFVATRLTEPLGLPAAEMIQPQDVAEAVRFLIRTSPTCVVPAIQLIRPTDRLFVAE